MLLLLFLSNWLHLNQWIFHLLPFQVSPQSCWWGTCACMGFGCWLGLNCCSALIVCLFFLPSKLIKNWCYPESNSLWNAFSHEGKVEVSHQKRLAFKVWMSNSKQRPLWRVSGQNIDSTFVQWVTSIYMNDAVNLRNELIKKKIDHYLALSKYIVILTWWRHSCRFPQCSPSEEQVSILTYAKYHLLF